MNVFACATAILYVSLRAVVDIGWRIFVVIVLLCVLVEKAKMSEEAWMYGISVWPIARKR
jgi:hypothetical protein